MPYEFYGKLFLLVLSSFCAIFSLLTIAKKKKGFQIFPDSTKKQFYKMVRWMTIANVLSAMLIVLSIYLLETNYAFLTLIVSMFLSVGALYAVYDEFGELNGEE